MHAKHFRKEFLLSRFLEHKREVFDYQYVFRHKTTDEYAEWKRKYDEDLQRAIKDHPIASTFLRLSKNINDYNVRIVD